MSTPLDGAGSAAVAKLFRMFSTEVAVSEVQLSHALTKQLSVTLAGDQLSNTLAGKEVMAEHPLHVLSKSVPAAREIAGKAVSEEHPLHALSKSVPESRSVTGQEVMAAQLYHA